MNNQIIKTPPSIALAEISIHMDDWQQKFLNLVNEGKAIQFDLYTMPTIPKNIEEELSKKSYRHLILESDDSQRFLVPPPYPK